MGLRSWIVRQLLKGATANEVGSWGVMPWHLGKPYLPPKDYNKLVERYTSWVYACAQRNAVNCAQVPLKLYAAKPSRSAKAYWPTRSVPAERLKYMAQSPVVGKYVANSVEVEEVLSHPFLDLIYMVNDWTNKFDLLESLFLYQELVGNAYWYIIRNELQIPQGIWPLMSQFVKIVPDKELYIKHFLYYITPADKHILEPENTIHFKYTNPQNAYYGLGPLQACVVAADLSLSMNLHETSLMKNRAMPDMALMFPADAGEPSPEAQERLYTQWKKKFRGTKKAGEMAILHGGAELKNLSLTPKELNYLKGREATLNEIAAVFGVPMSELTVKNVNRANAEAGDYSYMKKTILPKLRRAEEKMNEKLLPMFDERLFVAFENPVPQDKEYRLNEIDNHLKTGYSSINEERQIDGKEPVAWGEVPIMPFNVSPLGTATPAVLPPPAKAAIKSRRRFPPLNHPTNYVNEEFVQVIADYYRDVERDFLKNFDVDSENLLKSLHGRRYQQKGNVDDFMSSWFDTQKWNAEFAARTEPFIKADMVAGGERSLLQLESETIFNPANPRAGKVLEAHRFGSVQSVNGTIAKRLRRSIGDGVEATESLLQIRRRVESEFEDLERYQAVTIARTETIWAWNEGKVQGYMQSGVVEKKEWVSTGDSRSCFPAGAEITTEDGRAKIEDVKIGDAVLTHNGYRKVIQTMKRSYSKNMIKVKTADGQVLIATPEHPVYVKDKGWTEIGKLKINDRLQRDSNKITEVISIHNIKLFKPYDFIAKIAKFFVSLPVFRWVLMPIYSIDFKTDIPVREKKIYAVSIYRMFLNKFNVKSRQCFSDGFLNTSFTRVAAIARKATKSLCLFHAWSYSKSLFAVFAGNHNSRTATRLRTIPSVSSGRLFKREDFAAPQTHFPDNIFTLALQATNFVPVGFTAFDKKDFTANRASLFDFRRSAFLITKTGAVNSIALSGRSIKHSFAGWARFLGCNFSGCSITFTRAISRVAAFLNLVHRNKVFAAMFAGIGHIKKHYNSFITGCQSFYVYNLEVEDSHTYFANGLLVHNCDYCPTLDGKIVGVEANFFDMGGSLVNPNPEKEAALNFEYEDVGHPPLHPQCRCVIVPVIEEF